MFRYHRQMGGGGQNPRHKRFEQVYGGGGRRSRGAFQKKYLIAERERRRVRRRTHQRLKQEFAQNVATGRIRMLPDAQPRKKFIVKANEELGLSVDVQNLLGIHFSPHKIAFGSSLFRGNRFPVDATKFGSTYVPQQPAGFTQKFAEGVRETSFSNRYREINRLPTYDIWDPLNVERRESWLELHETFGEKCLKENLAKQTKHTHNVRQKHAAAAAAEAERLAQAVAGGVVDIEASQHALAKAAAAAAAAASAAENANRAAAKTQQQQQQQKQQHAAPESGGDAKGPPRVGRSLALLTAIKTMRTNRGRKPTFYTYADAVVPKGGKIIAKAHKPATPIKSPFGVKVKRFTLPADTRRETPGPGHYDVVNVRIGRNVAQQQNKASNRGARPAFIAGDGVCCNPTDSRIDLFRTGDFDIYYRCSPQKTDKCQCCTVKLGVDLNEYYYWNEAERIGICRDCYHLEEKRACMLTKDELTKFRRVRDCSFIHRHVVGTRQYITLLPLKILKHYERKQMYFSLFCNE